MIVIILNDYFSLQKQTPRFLRGFWWLRLLELCEVYNLSQLINVPTRITLHSETLVDLCPKKLLCAWSYIRTATGLRDQSVFITWGGPQEFRGGVH